VLSHGETKRVKSTLGFVRNGFLLGLLGVACGGPDDPAGTSETSPNALNQNEASKAATESALGEALERETITGAESTGSELTPLARAALLRSLQEQSGPEYGLTRAVDLERSLELVNPVHGLQGRFTNGALTLDAHRFGSLRGDAPGETLRVELRGVGRDGNLIDPALERTSSEGNRLAFERAGGVVEWYANGPGGLEHGLTLAKRPDGNGPLVVDLAVEGGLNPTFEGDRVALRGPGGHVYLTYRDLVATDANEEVVPAAFRVIEGRIQIVVDDSRAAYPLAIDPDWVAALSRTAQAFNSNNNHNVTMPATVDTGDLLLVLFLNDEANSVTTPSGWTQLFSSADPDSGQGDEAEVRLGAYAKDAVGNEDATNVDFVTTGGGADQQGAAHVYRITADAWEGTIAGGIATGTAANGDSTSPNPPNLTPSGWGALDTLWITMVGRDEETTATSVTAPTNYTTNHANTVCTDNNTCALSSSWRSITPFVSSEDPSNYTLGTARDWVTNTIAIRPAASCADDAACSDGNACTTDTCTNPGASGTCTYVAAASATVCRASVGVCDAAETCGGATTCPADAAAPSATVCRASVGACDVAETCGGASACPVDTAAPSATVCRAAAGVCDTAETCGGATTCPSDAKSTAQCRAAVGACDVADMCNGVSNDCPADAKSTAVCRPATDLCDLPDSCDGVSNVCPANVLAPRATVCRASVSACDAAETCSGSAATCPADAALAAGAPCGSAGADACTAADTCDGNFVCQSNNVSDGTMCGGACGIAGTCTAGVCSAAQFACSDGDACNGTETCGGAACVAGTALDCNDNVACTTDSCGGSRCSHPPEDTACNTGAGEVCNRALGCSLCGNGIVDTGEECDTAGDTTTCDEDCTVPSCGDSWVNPALGEQCDGTNLDGQTCESMESGTGTVGSLSCDTCVLVTSTCDGDADGVADGADNCPTDPNVDQADIDVDGIGDVCDGLDNNGGAGGGGAGGAASGGSNAGGTTSGGTNAGGIGSGGDNGTGGAESSVDTDLDGVPDSTDSCVDVKNPAQTDEDNDGRGDCCDIRPGGDITVLTVSPDDPTTIEAEDTIITVRVGAVSEPTCVVVSVNPEGLTAPEDVAGDVIGIAPDVIPLDVPAHVCVWVGSATNVTLAGFVDGAWVTIDSRVRNGEVCANVDTLTPVTVLSLPVEPPPAVVDAGPTEGDDDVMPEPGADDDMAADDDAAADDDVAADDDMAADDDGAADDDDAAPNPSNSGPRPMPTMRPMPSASPSSSMGADAGLPPLPEAAPPAEDGCGCRTVGQTSPTSSIALLLLTLVFGLRRRRTA
jgi:hypothetical protein